MRVERSSDHLPRPIAVAVATFDGMHVGHRAIVRAASDTQLPVAVVMSEADAESPLLCTVGRRLELLEEWGVPDVVLVPDRRLLAQESIALQRNPENVVVDARELEGAAADLVREALQAGDMALAADRLGRPAEVEGTVVGGDARGRTLGFPTANVAVANNLVLPRFGIYAGWAAGTRAAISIGTNPTFGGGELRVEAFLLDFDGDLYGQRLVVELWERLRDEAAFATEGELVEQIADDVRRTRAARRPNVSGA